MAPGEMTIFRQQNPKLYTQLALLFELKDYQRNWSQFVGFWARRYHLTTVEEELAVQRGFDKLWTTICFKILEDQTIALLVEALRHADIKEYATEVEQWWASQSQAHPTAGNPTEPPRVQVVGQAGGQIASPIAGVSKGIDRSVGTAIVTPPLTGTAKEEAEFLEEYFDDKLPSFSELHTHLSGMGDPEFWSNIMKDFLPKRFVFTSAVALLNAFNYSNNVAALY
jgi:hypothetical protein